MVMGVCLRKFGLNMNLECDIFFIPSWARVRRVALGSGISV